MRRLAQQAQVSTRTLYNLYGAKEDIVYALMSETMASIDEILQESSDPDPLARSYTLTRLSVERLLEGEELHRNLIRASKLEPGSSREPLLIAQMRSMHEILLGQAREQGQLRPGFSPRVLAHQLVITYGQGVRFWGNGVLDRHSLRVHSLHSWGLVLLGAVTDSAREPIAAVVAELHPEAERVIDRLEELFANPTERQRAKFSEHRALEPGADVALAGSV